MTSIVTPRPLVLGLDPSPLRLGYALAEWDTGRPKWCGTLLINQADAGWVEHQIARAIHLVWKSVGNHPEYYVATAAVERMFVGPKASTSLELADNAGIVCGILSQWGIPIYRFRPAEWRKACGLKGNATKQEVYDHATLAGFKLPKRGTKENGQDAADAGLIALAAFNRNSFATLVKDEGTAAQHAA